MRKIITTIATVLILSTSLGFACGNYLGPMYQEVLDMTRSENREVAMAAADVLHDLGPEGYEIWKNSQTEEVSISMFTGFSEGPFLPGMVRDRILGCYGSERYQEKLYWYTNAEKAIYAAEGQGKPILSLRLLGRLDEELSCANSRYFRDLLYTDPEVATYLNENFILHWESVAKVPIISIDFGNGQTLRRTITGNSIHYILDSKGRVVDGIPGLYDGKKFREVLETARMKALEFGDLEGDQRTNAMVEYHTEADKTAKAEWEEILKKNGWGKSVEEWGDLEWLALMDKTDAELVNFAGQDSYASARNTAWKAPQASRVAMSKVMIENSTMAALRNLGKSVMIDTMKNEYDLHRQIHQMLATNPTANVEIINNAVYAEVFRMPLYDQFLGLAPADRFAALPDGKFTENNGKSTVSYNPEPRRFGAAAGLQPLNIVPVVAPDGSASNPFGAGGNPFAQPNGNSNSVK